MFIYIHIPENAISAVICDKYFLKVSQVMKVTVKLSKLLFQLNRLGQICSVCRNHNPVLFSCMTNHRVSNKSNTTGVTCGADTAYSPGATYSPRLVRFMLLDL